MRTRAALTSFAPGSGARVQPRAHLESSAEVIDLAGQWDFSYSRSAEGAGDEATTEDFDTSGWDSITVPSHWVLTGGGEFGAFGKYGAPAYQNIDFPFPVDVPNVPDDNPTGDYRTHFELSAPQRSGADRIYLRTLGIESLAVVWVNGREAGEIRGSRLTQELDITDMVREGRNTLHMRVHQWSSNTYLEDQDQWWLPGIFRDVQVLLRPHAGIDDVWLRADFDPVNGSTPPGPGALIPEIRAHESAFPITITVPELEVEQVFDSSADVGPIEIGDVEPWSADVPRLYAATVSNAVEEISLRVGFRRVSLEGHEWRVNGKKLRIRGVNRHEYDPEHGRVWDREKAREGLMMMKRHNINAIRTSHYPPHPEFFDLTDELGFWVMDECDYEAHGFEASGWRDVPANDPRWRDNLLDRVERFFERDKNHPSIVSMSLGNEGHTGSNMAAMAAWLHDRDPERPVHYEPDFNGEYTDLVSRMYPPIEHMRQMSAGQGQGRSTIPGRNAVLASRPMILCEYVHAMGNGPGGLSDYEALFNELPQWHGGFIWEWRDHGILTKRPNGTEFYAYGGDFGEEIHDGSFVCDGLVLADGTPSPGLAETKAVFAPLALHVSGDGRAIDVLDLRHAGELSDFRFEVVDEIDGHEVSRTELAIDSLDADDNPASTDLPGLDLMDRARSELIRTVVATLRHDTAWASAGHEVAFAQVHVPHRRAIGGPPPVRERITGAQFDQTTGELIRLGNLNLTGPRLLLWRAPTENDSLSDFGSYLLADPADSLGEGVPGPSAAALWEADGLHRLQRRIINTEVSDTHVWVLHRYAPAASRAYVDLEIEWTMNDSGALRLHASATPSRGWDHPWARLGLEFTAPLGAGRVSWFGTGPEENYPDSHAAARVGRFARDVHDLVTDYAVPQESGHRADARSVALEGLGFAVETECVGPYEQRPGFTIREHSVAQVAAATHPHELPAPERTHLVFDVAHHGVGTRSCGPDVRPEHQLRPRSGTWKLEFSVSDS